MSLLKRKTQLKHPKEVVGKLNERISRVKKMEIAQEDKEELLDYLTILRDRAKKRFK